MLESECWIIVKERKKEVNMARKKKLFKNA